MRTLSVKRFLKTLLILLAANTGLSGIVTCGANELDEEIERLEVFSQIYHLIHHEYITPLSRGDLIDMAIDGMVNELDDYSVLLDADEVGDIESSSVGKTTGIGIQVQRLEGQFKVTKVLRSSPAARGGLLTGDVILEANGNPLSHLSDEALLQTIRGEPGSQIKLRFHHAGMPENVIDEFFTREIIVYDSVESFEVDERVLVLQIHEFQKKTPAECRRFLGQKNYLAVILDLRDNAGGLLISGIETAELFLPVGLIMETRDQRGETTETYVSRGSRKIIEKRLVVLINEYTASSAEIVAGSIKDRKAGTLVGERSFGKGVAQTIYPIGEQKYLKLTTARFYLPSGETYDQKGIAPDYIIQDNPEHLRYQDSDLPFQKALELIQGMEGFVDATID